MLRKVQASQLTLIEEKCKHGQYKAKLPSLEFRKYRNKRNNMENAFFLRFLGLYLCFKLENLYQMLVE